MHKTLMGVISGVAVTLAALLTFNVQAANLRQTRIGPLVIDIQQQIPLTTTLQVPIGVTDTYTATVPMALDLNLQIGLSSTMSPEITIGTGAGPMISVSELTAQDQLTVDNNNLPYELEGVEGVEIIQFRTDRDFAEDFNMVGEVRNANSERILDRVEFTLTFYDESGNILDVDNGYMALDSVEPGATSPFEVITSTPFDDIARYLIQVEADFE